MDQGIVIDRTILPDEQCVRCVYVPYHYSMKSHRLKREAFLPEADCDCISLLRLRYCSMDFCMEHGTRIGNPPGKVFCSVAMLSQELLDEMNSWAQSDKSKEKHDSPVNGQSLNIMGTPMFNVQDYCPESMTVTTGDPSVQLPMHADARYPQPMQLGEVCTRMRRYASELCRRVTYGEVSDGSVSTWYQEKC